MIRDIFQKLLHKSGKNYEIDQRIPSGLLYRFLFTRACMRIRGLYKTGKKVFIGKNVRLFNSRNIVFGQHVTLENHCEIDAYASDKILLGDGVKIGAYSFVTTTSHMSKYGKGLKIGNNSACGRYCEFGASGGIEIGNDVIMGSYVSFHSENHNFSDPNKPIREQGVTSKGIKIGNNVWVGAKATFLDGCQVGNNCVVAAGAVVAGNFPDNVIIGGVPAKVLKQIDYENKA